MECFIVRRATNSFAKKRIRLDPRRVNKRKEESDVVARSVFAVSNHGRLAEKVSVSCPIKVSIAMNTKVL